MKKTLITLSLGLFVTTSLLAQDENEYSSDSKSSKVRFGAYIAPNISWMRPANSKSSDGAYNVTNNGSKTGFTWGILMDYWFADRYALATGLQINGTGGKIVASRIDQTATPNTVYNADFNYNLQYLEIPVNIKLKTAPITNGMYFFGQAGLTGGFNIGKKATYTVKATDALNNMQDYSEEKVKLSGTLAVAPMNFQLNVGLGVHYPFSDRMAAYAGLFFNNGFAPDVTNPAKYNLIYPGSYSDGNIRLNNFALRLGLFF